MADRLTKEQALKEAEGKETSFRSCWNCNPSHEHLKKANYPILCFGCWQYFYKGVQLSEGKGE